MSRTNNENTAPLQKDQTTSTFSVKSRHLSAAAVFLCVCVREARPSASGLTADCRKQDDASDDATVGPQSASDVQIYTKSSSNPTL